MAIGIVPPWSASVRRAPSCRTGRNSMRGAMIAMITIVAIGRSSRSHRQGCSHRRGRIRSTASGPTISALLGSRCSPSITATSRSNPDLNSNRRSTAQSNRLQEPRKPCLTAGLLFWGDTCGYRHRYRLMSSAENALPTQSAATTGKMTDVSPVWSMKRPIRGSPRPAHA